MVVGDHAAIGIWEEAAEACHTRSCPNLVNYIGGKLFRDALTIELRALSTYHIEQDGELWTESFGEVL